jgi:hypothetical protein
MTRFNLTIETRNSAFDPEEGGAHSEIARILHELADRLADGSETSGGLYDFNGNRVGNWKLS